jgi:hypothetical protein
MTCEANLIIYIKIPGGKRVFVLCNYLDLFPFIIYTKGNGILFIRDLNFFTAPASKPLSILTSGAGWRESGKEGAKKKG